MTTLADAYDMIAEGFATAALALRAQDAPEASPLPDMPADTNWTETDDWDAATEAAVTAKAAGSAAVCPAHGTEYREGKYGPYCPNLGTDPKWTNERGYCTVTPKNAAAYLRQKAAG